MLFWSTGRAHACSRPREPVPAIEFVGVEADTIPRNGAILVTLSTSPLAEEPLTATVFSDGSAIGGTLKAWPGWVLPRRPTWQVAWVPAALLPADATLTFRFEIGLSTERPQSQRALLLEGVVRTTREVAPPITVGDIRVRVNRRANTRVGNCATECGPCETVGVDYHHWAEITVLRAQGGWSVGGYALVPWFDASGEYGTEIRSDGDSYGTLSETGEGTASLFLRPSRRAYRPCFTAEVRSLSGSARSAPVCLPAGTFTAEFEENGGCSVNGGRGQQSGVGVLSIVSAFAIGTLALRRRRRSALSQRLRLSQRASVRASLVSVTVMALVSCGGSGDERVARQRRLWEERRPEAYVVQVCDVGGYLHGCSRAAVQGREVTAAQRQTRPDASFEPVDDLSQFAEPIDRLFDVATGDSEHCRLESLQFDPDFGYVSAYHVDCGEEAGGERVACFVANTRRLEECDGT
jgi:hypothetical protein